MGLSSDVSELQRLLEAAWEAARAGDQEASAEAWDLLRRGTRENLTASLRREFGSLPFTDLRDALHDAYVDRWLKLWEERSSAEPRSEPTVLGLALIMVRTRARHLLLEDVPGGRRTRSNPKAELKARTVSLDSLKDRSGELALADVRADHVAEIMARDLLVYVLPRVLSRFAKRREEIDEILGELIAGLLRRQAIAAQLGMPPSTLSTWIGRLHAAFIEEFGADR